MATATPPKAVKYFAAVLASDAASLSYVEKELARAWGVPDGSFGPIPFVATDYYRDGVGDTPLRAFFAFPRLFPPDELVERKEYANALELHLAAALATGLPRPVNIDPGYLALDKIVLASAKNFSHRIHIARGIYAEVTLQYRQGRFCRLPWTFPEYATGDYDPFFLEMRRRLAAETDQASYATPSTGAPTRSKILP